MKITIYGSGCAKCKQVEDLVKKIVAETGVNAEVVKVSDMREMISAGVLSTPAVGIDGIIKASGRIPGAEEIKNWIAN